MFRKMRRSRQILPESETRAIIEKTATAVLGVNGDDGYPYTVPVNTVMADGKLYFHSAKAGHKIDAIKKDPKVSLSFIDREDVVSAEYTTYFRSAQVFGRAMIIEDGEEKEKAFRALCEKFCKSDLDRYDEVMSNEAARAVIVRVEIEQMSGKEAIELVKERNQEEQ